MQVPGVFPNGCQFYTTVREIRMYVKYAERSFYVLSLNGLELIKLEGAPLHPMTQVSEDAFRIAATRCKTFYAGLISPRNSGGRVIKSIQRQIRPAAAAAVISN